MVKVYNPFNSPPFVPTAHGERYRIKYTKKVNDDLTESLIETGKTDIFEFIQSFADSVSLEKIIRRAELGDPTGLTQRQGVYMDASGMPRDLAQTYQLVAKAQAYFNNLPESIRKDYADTSAFLQVFQDGKSFTAFCDKYLKKPVPKSAAMPAAKSVVNGGDLNESK